MNKVLISKNSDIWETPKEYYNVFINKGFFDPCPINPNFDGLKINWKRKNFVNPPYSQIKKWIDKSIIEFEKGKIVVLLVPSRTDTKWFRLLVDFGCDIYFITGRLKFSGQDSAPFPSCLIKLNGFLTKTEWIERW